MKKFLSILLSLIMLVTTQVIAFATDGFVKSPTANLTPQVIEGTHMGGDAYQVVVHSYGERENLNADQKVNMENAYNSIKAAEKLTDLNADFKEVAKDKNIKEDDLSVSDIFYVNYQDNDGEVLQDSGSYKIKLKADTLQNFAGLMYYDGENWSKVENAKINDEGYLEFTTDKEGTFAVVVDTASVPAVATPAASEKDRTNQIIIGSVIGAVVLTFIIIVAVKRKSKKDENK